MKDVMKSRKNLIGYKDNPIGLFPLKVDLQFVSLLAKVATAFTRSFKAIANRERNKFPKLPTQLLVTINYPNNCRSQNNAQDINKQMRTKQQLYSSHHK